MVAKIMTSTLKFLLHLLYSISQIFYCNNAIFQWARILVKHCNVLQFIAIKPMSDLHIDCNDT